jgi:hypothetical protein
MRRVERLCVVVVALRIRIIEVADLVALGTVAGGLVRLRVVVGLGVGLGRVRHGWIRDRGEASERTGADKIRCTETSSVSSSCTPTITRKRERRLLNASATKSEGESAVEKNERELVPVRSRGFHVNSNRPLHVPCGKIPCSRPVFLLTS